jgi:hypothetical protein
VATTPFRLTLLNGAVFALAVVALLGMIYWRTAGYMSRQLDAIIVAEAKVLTGGEPMTCPSAWTPWSPPTAGRSRSTACSPPTGRWIAGNVATCPPSPGPRRRPA